MIDLSLIVTDVLSVNDAKFSISLYAFLGLRWIEPRLRLRLHRPPGRNSTTDCGVSDGAGLGVDVDPKFLE